MRNRTPWPPKCISWFPPPHRSPERAIPQPTPRPQSARQTDARKGQPGQPASPFDWKRPEPIIAGWRRRPPMPWRGARNPDATTSRFFLQDGGPVLYEFVTIALGLFPGVRASQFGERLEQIRDFPCLPGLPQSLNEVIKSRLVFGIGLQSLAALLDGLTVLARLQVK